MSRVDVAVRAPGTGGVDVLIAVTAAGCVVRVDQAHPRAARQRVVDHGRPVAVDDGDCRVETGLVAPQPSDRPG